MNMTSAIFWIILTAYHEARGEYELGQKIVAKVILTRAKNKNWPVSNVVLSKKQFSCFNFGLDHPSLQIKDIPSLIKISATMLEAIKEWESGDTMDGATHYYASSGPNKIKPPYWAASMTVIGTFGHHTLLREGDRK